MSPNPDRERRIRQRAYALWEDEGYPEGRELDHWERAEREIEAEEGHAWDHDRDPRRP